MNINSSRKYPGVSLSAGVLILLAGSSIAYAEKEKRPKKPKNLQSTLSV